mmetsp:Transcript_1808/g.3523  ORF Transcript_1808/g.3523 Transcript_1808/m.3523 type:complete len:142 (-) Transcript_1808:2050-2475(-)
MKLPIPMIFIYHTIPCVHVFPLLSLSLWKEGAPLSFSLGANAVLALVILKSTTPPSTKYHEYRLRTLGVEPWGECSRSISVPFSFPAVLFFIIANSLKCRIPRVAFACTIRDDLDEREDVQRYPPSMFLGYGGRNTSATTA